MKVLLDEGVPHPTAKYLRKHNVETVPGLGWGSVKNGKLLALAEGAHFEVFVTGDRNMEHQQSLSGRPFAVLILSTINWPVMRGNMSAVVEAVERAVPGTVLPIDCGKFRPRPKERASNTKLII